MRNEESTVLRSRMLVPRTGRLIMSGGRGLVVKAIASLRKDPSTCEARFSFPAHGTVPRLVKMQAETRVGSARRADPTFGAPFTRKRATAG